MRLVVVILFLIFQSTGFCSGDTTFHGKSEFHISYDETSSYDQKYTIKDSRTPFTGWIIDTLSPRTFSVFFVRDGFRDGFLLRYEQKKNKLLLTCVNVYHNHECYIIAFLSFKKSNKAHLSQLVFLNPYRYNKDTLVSKDISFSEKDSTYSYSILYEKRKRSISGKVKYKLTKSPDVPDEDLNCFHAFSLAITYLPQVLENIDQLNYPKYYLRFGCGIDFVPVFKEYAPKSE
jgi:hypothetical protein